MPQRRYVFIGGLHKSGTSLLAGCLAGHPAISGFHDTGVPEDEGQHLQSVFPPASAFGGAGKFGFDPEAHLTETSSLVSQESRDRLLSEWGRHWDLRKDILLEKSPPNLIRMRFLQALFPEAKFVVVTRHPVAVAYATRKWSHTSIESLIEHWLACHETFERDRSHITRLKVVRYEDLVEQPQAILAGIFSFLNLEPVECGIGVRRDVNAQYLRMWREDSQGSPTQEREIVRKYSSRVAAFNYQLSFTG